MKNRTKWLVGALVVVLLVGAGVVLTNPELYRGFLKFERPIQPETVEHLDVRERFQVDDERTISPNDFMDTSEFVYRLDSLRLDLERGTTTHLPNGLKVAPKHGEKDENNQCTYKCGWTTDLSYLCFCIDWHTNNDIN